MISYHLTGKEKLSHFMSGNPPIIYTALLIVGSLFIYAFLDLSSIKFATSEKARTQGVITKVFEYYDDDSIESEYLFSFEVKKEAYVSSSFSEYNEGNQGDTVKVEYIISAPNNARIFGSSHDDDKVGYTILGVSMVLIALIGFSFSYKKLRKLQRILRQADVVKSFEATSKVTSIYVNDKPLHKITYHYVVDQTLYQVSKLNSQGDTIPSKVGILYSEDNPGNAVLLSKLPSELERKIKAIKRDFEKK